MGASCNTCAPGYSGTNCNECLLINLPFASFQSLVRQAVAKDIAGVPVSVFATPTTEDLAAMNPFVHRSVKMEGFALYMGQHWLVYVLVAGEEQRVHFELVTLIVMPTEPATTECL
jgi:hypothetical protein